MTQSLEVEGNVTVTQIRKVTYSQDWASYNMTQNEEVMLSDSMLSDLIADVEEPV